MDKQAVEEIKQHFGIVAEGLESKIEIIAEGHALLRVETKKSVEEFRLEVRELRRCPVYDLAVLHRDRHQNRHSGT